MKTFDDTRKICYIDASYDLYINVCGVSIIIKNNT